MITMEMLLLTTVLFTFFLLAFGVWKIRSVDARGWSRAHRDVLVAATTTGPTDLIPDPERPPPVFYEIVHFLPPELSLDALPNEVVSVSESDEVEVYGGPFGSMEPIGLHAWAATAGAPWTWTPETQAWYEAALEQSIGPYRASLRLAD
jgi:hypothetical protein